MSERRTGRPAAEPRVSPLMKRLILFERRQQPLVSVAGFARRLGVSTLVAMGMIGVSLGIGVVGYRVSGGLGWLDSLYNASMILGGMGPVDNRPTVPDAEKWFASLYALFAGVVFLVSVGVLLAPVFHRFIHHFHLDVGGEDT